MGGSPPDAALPQVGYPRTRRQAVSSATRRPVTALQDIDRSVLLAPGILSPRKDHHQGHAQGRVPSGRPLTLIFHGKIRHLSGGRAILDSRIAGITCIRGLRVAGKKAIDFYLHSSHKVVHTNFTRT